MLLAAVLLAGCVEAGPEQTPRAADTARPHDDRRFTVNPDQSAFEALAGATAYHGTVPGIHGDAAYRIEVPDQWNGVLVMYARYRGVGPNLAVGNPSIREHLIGNGYAWGASSYSANYYDVRAGVEDTNALALSFPEITGRPTPDKYYVIGHSMGGHISAAAVERETLATAANRVEYAGVVALCGVTGDTELFDYFMAFNYAAHQLAGLPPRTFPIPNHDELLPEILEVLWEDYESDRTDVTAQGKRLKGILMNLSGRPRPLFDEAFPAFTDQLFGYGGSDGTWRGIVPGNIVNTTHIVFRFGTGGDLTPGERAFNEAIYRIDGDRDAKNPLRDDGVRWIPLVQGDFDVPVVTLHMLGDLLAPFSMQQIYARRAAERGSDHWLVQRAIRGPAHCAFTAEEETAAFDAMAAWEEDGVKPGGDDVLDPETVASADYGCAHTAATRPGMPPCPLN